MRFLIGWAAPKALQVLADDHRGGPLTLSHTQNSEYPFPVYTEDPPQEARLSLAMIDEVAPLAQKQWEAPPFSPTSATRSPLTQGKLKPLGQES